MARKGSLNELSPQVATFTDVRARLNLYHRRCTVRAKQILQRLINGDFRTCGELDRVAPGHQPRDSRRIVKVIRPQEDEPTLIVCCAGAGDPGNRKAGSPRSKTFRGDCPQKRKKQAERHADWGANQRDGFDGAHILRVYAEHLTTRKQGRTNGA